MRALRLIVVIGTAALAAVTVVVGTHVRLYRVTQSSMEPTLHCAAAAGCQALRDDSILVSEIPLWFRGIHRDDLVALHDPTGTDILVKRVVGLSGERVEERHGTVLINGRVLKEPYVSSQLRDRRNFGPVTVPAGSYFVLGDDRIRSRDSRAFGAISRSAIVGVLVARYAPRARIRLFDLT